MRIRSHLLLLAAVVLVPGFLAAGIAIDKVREGERQAALRGLRETVRATALLVDGEVKRSIGALTALAHSQSLADGRLEALYREAKAIDQPPDVWTLLVDDSGMQRFNTLQPYGTPNPPAQDKVHVDRTIALNRPYVTDLFVDPVSQRLLTTIYLPTPPSAAGRFIVAQAFSVDHWKKLIAPPKEHSQWVVAVFDHEGRFISRSLRAEERLGKPARPELVAAAASAADGLIRHSTLEGVDSYDAFTRSALTGWTIAVAAPVETIEASATQAVTWLALGVASALAAALLGASMLSHVLIRAMESASAAARALGSATPTPVARTKVQEFDALHDALADAARLLAEAKTAREQVEAERGRLLDNERASREAAQGENAAKDQFIALLGHELRNPLAAIAGATEVLSRRVGDAQAQEKFLAIIQRQNRHLKRIVDDLLDVSRMLSGKIALSGAPMNLGDCVRSCIESLRMTLHEGGAGIALQVEGPAWIDGDPVRIEQIVNNLVTNALRFAPPDSDVRVRVRREGDQVLLDVADTGPGIPQAMLSRIFEPFIQGPPPAGRQPSGLGIGLALVRQLVQLHGGQVQVRTGADVGVAGGTLFTVSLPAMDPHAR